MPSSGPIKAPRARVRDMIQQKPKSVTERTPNPMPNLELPRINPQQQRRRKNDSKSQ